MSVLDLARPEIRGLRGYKTAAADQYEVRLNANESPLATGTQSAHGVNRYPDIRPTELTRKMARFYEVGNDNVLVTRGSSEGIDLLMRTFCVAGKDNVLLTPPVFEMYQIYATVQGVQTIDLPLLPENDFALDVDALLDACSNNTKLIFLCSPNNPLGTTISHDQVLRILQARAGRSVVVLDEAYIEFSELDSLVKLVTEFRNLVVLRTLSKARALAGARCGAVIASSEIVQLLDGVLAPYALSSPVIASAEAALSVSELALSDRAIRHTVIERERVYRELSDCKAIQNIWPSQANFLFVRLACPADVERCLKEAGIIIRTYSDDPALQNCARITISTEDDNDRLIKALRNLD